MRSSAAISAASWDVARSSLDVDPATGPDGDRLTVPHPTGRPDPAGHPVADHAQRLGLAVRRRQQQRRPVAERRPRRAEQARVGAAERLHRGVGVADEHEVDVRRADHLQQPGRRRGQLLGVVDDDGVEGAAQPVERLVVLLEQVGRRAEDPGRVVGARPRERGHLVVLGQDAGGGHPLGPLVLPPQPGEVLGLQPALDRPHQQVAQLGAKAPGAERRLHVLGPGRRLALTGGVAGEQLAQDDVLLGPAEQPRRRVAPQRGGLTQDAEPERLVGPRQRLGGGAAEPGGDALAQVGGGHPGGGQRQHPVG